MSWTNKTKNTSSYSNDTRNVSSYSNTNLSHFLKFLMLEGQYKILVGSDEDKILIYDEPITYTNQIKN